jgi:ribose transport system substrate-binding protein
MRPDFALPLLLLTLLLPLGCSRKTDTPDAPAKKLKGVVGISVLTMTNPFFKEIADVFTEEMGKHGYSVLAVSGDYNVAKQRSQVQDFLVKKAAAIVLCPCDSRAIGAVIREANDAGVPVFTADIACLDPDAKIVTHVATDNYAGGKQAAQAMIEALGEASGKVLILDFKQVESCLLRVKGFKEVMEEHNKGRTAGRVQIVAELPGDGDKEKGFKTTADALERYPDLAGIFAINDPSALGAYVALEKANKTAQVKLIAFDGQPEGKQAIRDGKIYADPIQHPDEIGRKTAQAILGYFQGEPPQREILIPTNLYRKADAEKDASLAK